MKESDGRVLACTTANFTGIIALLRQGTWVSRFNGLQGRRPGVYALTVQGEIPSRILNESDYEEEDTAIASNIEEEKAAAATPTIKGTVEGSTSATPRLPPKLKAPKEAKPKKTPKEVKPKKPKEVKPKEPKASKQKPSTPAATSPEDSDTDSEGPLLGDAAKYLDDISSLGDSDEEPADKQPEKPSAPEPALEPPAKRLRPAAEDILEPEGDTEFRRCAAARGRGVSACLAGLLLLLRWLGASLEAFAGGRGAGAPARRCGSDRRAAPERAEEGMRAWIEYTGVLEEDGQIFASTDGQEPLSFILGEEGSWVEEATVGLAPGEARDVYLGEDRPIFGPWREDRLDRVALGALPRGAKKGSRLQLRGSEYERG
ncbi:unnamed protein product [Prorocentrum cordatum]|uniref:Spt4/RpoE2 zinc finger domain-containing protein n=2 Tax=Prorocentrum cordatum TaxID=2364126 RepID=A0ABN9XPT4_9DINO|nr:unnamed protein product [Polarella glacialis]